MSYSFAIDADNKADAKTAVAAELAKVVETQPIHERDRAQAQAAADAFIDLLPDSDSQGVHVSVHGSLGWTGPQEDPTITSSNVSVGAALMPRA